MYSVETTEAKELERKLAEKKRSLLEEDDVCRLLRSLFEVSDTPMGNSALLLSLLIIRNGRYHFRYYKTGFVEHG